MMFTTISIGGRAGDGAGGCVCHLLCRSQDCRPAALSSPQVPPINTHPPTHTRARAHTHTHTHTHSLTHSTHAIDTRTHTHIQHVSEVREPHRVMSTLPLPRRLAVHNLPVGSTLFTTLFTAHDASVTTGCQNARVGRAYYRYT